MSWIESHQSLERHPKVLKLQQLLGVSLEHTLGVLHRFWWWCLDYAEDGDLRRHPPETVSSFLGFDVQKMIDANLIDDKPYKRVHDWWDYVCHFMWVKYKNQPKKWKRIQRLYKGRSNNRCNNPDKNLNLNHNLPKPLNNNSPPIIPPKGLTDIQKVVKGWKIIKGIPKDDRTWDKVHYKRCSRPARELLDLFGDWQQAVDCIEYVYDYMTKKKLSCTLETVVKHSDMFREKLAKGGR